MFLRRNPSALRCCARPMLPCLVLFHADPKRPGFASCSIAELSWPAQLNPYLHWIFKVRFYTTKTKKTMINEGKNKITRKKLVLFQPRAQHWHVWHADVHPWRNTQESFFWTGADEESRQCHVKKAATGRAWHWTAQNLLCLKLYNKTTPMDMMKTFEKKTVRKCLASEQ